jgi:hypothetical protein
MNWYKSAIRVRELTVKKALELLGLSPGASEQEIKAARNSLARRYHSDKTGVDNERMSDVNVAYEFLRAHGYNSSINNANEIYESDRNRFWRGEENKSRSRDLPPWQTDFRSSYNDVGEDFCNLNFCKKSIWEESLKNGEVDKYSILPFDGNFFRHSFMVMTNDSALGYAGKINFIWNTQCACSYNIKAVFAQKFGSAVIQLVFMPNGDLTPPWKEYSYEYSSGNPGNDMSFIKKLRKEFGESKEKS